jgi:hypothetical protein
VQFNAKNPLAVAGGHLHMSDNPCTCNACEREEGEVWICMVHGVMTEKKRAENGNERRPV